MSECPAARRRVAAERDVPPPAALGSNGSSTGAAKTSVRGLVHSAQTVVRLAREYSAYPAGLRNVDYKCFDG